ncbi:YdeI/OmpD-associated family protein (plasmid) [Streptomyces sp. NBC_01005]|uniref:YdeI/OmpD-associated family protein n=1 Tax=unclassified Streptomyces TaxID=2593676 RepID=UPI002F90EF44|nr:YdeI/OmpD-associated family protein [Streptomyces sp. NBC_01005]WTD00468.1 YdeI/OmpD-associated family protein [Streptomyces sp. NBC_01650]
MDEIDGVGVIAFTDAAAFENWLAEHNARSSGIWVRVAKKKSGISTVSDDEMVDIGLCYGWISGQRRSLDERYYLQKYVPRRPRSLWSRVNVDKVAKLTAEGRMREPGLTEVRKAQQDGRWEAAYESQRTATAPPELLAALDADPGARKAFEALDRSGRYQLILPLLQALTPETRKARLDKALHRLMHDGPAEAE